MAKKQTIIKKPVGNGNISITIENNLKNTNSAPPPVKKRRRRKQLPTTDETNSMIENMLRGGRATGGGGGVNLPPLKDVSYIKPPSNNFTVWRDNFNDSYNTTIPQGQAQQMGLLQLPKVEAPPVAPPSQLALTAPPTADTPLTMREFAAIMMQQGKARPGYQNLHEDPYNDDEPMEERFADLSRAYEKSSDIYANLRPSSRIEEIEQDVLKEAGATDEQIQNYQEQIKQQKASVSTTNEQKLEAAGIDPEIVKNVKKIAVIKTAGTWQGKRNIKPNGPYINDPNFIASYNAARALRLSKEPSERETPKRPENFTFLAEGEDPWNIDYQDAVSEQPEDIFYDAKTETEEQEMMKMREALVKRGLRKDTMTEEERKLKKKVDEDIQEIMKERKAAQLINRAVKGRNARKEIKELKELEAIQVNQEEQAGKVITKAAQRYQEKKRKKALVEKLKADLEAEIAKLKEDLKAGRPQPQMATKKVLSKAMESLKDFWKKDMTEEEERQARKDARQAKKDAQQKTEDKLAAKAKALREKRAQLEALQK